CTEVVRARTDVDGRLTVVICTHNRPTELRRALDSLANQTATGFHVLVIDNAPTGSETKSMVDSYVGLQTLKYCCEARRGLSNARNTALAHVETELIAWLDDDEIADASWVAELVKAFDSELEVDAVVGPVIPAELETWPQLWFEQYGGHSKGRRFEPAAFIKGDTGEQSPLYPLPPFGTGANMAFRTTSLTALGGFDPALGAGTPACGGEDTLVFSQLLWRKATVIHNPYALTHHFHRRNRAELERQMYGYGVGLTALYMALLSWQKRLILPLIKLAPRALRDMFLGGGAATAELPDSFPRELLAIKTKGMLHGPGAYRRARRAFRRDGR
ncbi:MAG: glycosyltransferase, partial [Nocardiaceae bacterium]|nr:glycosyltransferase [Nocardiaceae bacterium]